MYASEIIERRLNRAKREGLTYSRLPRDESIARTAELELLRDDGRGGKLPDRQLSRPVTKSEQSFIDSELLLCKVDFEYWMTRYACLELDPGVTADGKGGIAPPILAESQHHYIHLLAKKELEIHQEVKEYGFTRGILAYFHKTRQVMATATARALTWHRLLLWGGTRAFCASFDDEAIGELFKRDHVILDNLPWWMAPVIYPDVKDTEIGLEPPIQSRIGYQAESKLRGGAGVGIGTGTQADVSHLTEVALWNHPNQIDFSFVPAIPKSLTTLHIQESTANGKGNYWYHVTEAARHKHRGYEHFIYAFIPWWFNRNKYRAIPPPGWEPDKHTLLHAELIERTSPEFNEGRTYRPTKEQLYWWESERANHVKKMALAEFLTNYPATPEQSFQNPNQGALPAELLEIMETEIVQPVPYEVEIVA